MAQSSRADWQIWRGACSLQCVMVDAVVDDILAAASVATAADVNQSCLAEESRRDILAKTFEFVTLDFEGKVFNEVPSAHGVSVAAVGRVRGLEHRAVSACLNGFDHL